MKSLWRNLAVLLFLGVLPLPHSHLFTHAASTSSPVTRPRIIFMTSFGTDDYEDEDEDYHDKKSSPPEVLSEERTPLFQGRSEFCPYDPCLENQEPCAVLAKKTGCRCPGISGADKPPHPPRIQGLVPVIEGGDNGKIEVQWCAPSSVVSGYKVVIEGREADALEFKDVARRGVIGYLEVGTKVCVEALNNAGQSIPSEFSCRRYEIHDSSDHKLLAAVIGGGVGFLLLLVIAAVILWKYKMRQKAKRGSTDGLGNPSYSRGETL